MGNCIPSGTSHTTNPRSKQLNVSSPRTILSRQDVVYLLIGPVGAEVASFVELAMQQQSLSGPQTLQGPTRFSEDDIRTFKASVPGLPKAVVLVVPPLFDGAGIKEKDVIDGVKLWLRCTKDQPYIDHILYFTEAGSHYQIPLAPLCSYLSSLENLCGTPDRKKLCSKISLVNTAAFQVPASWAFLEINGSRKFTFEEAVVGSAQSILREIAVQSSG